MSSTNLPFFGRGGFLPPFFYRSFPPSAPLSHMFPDKPSSPPTPIRSSCKRYRCSYGHRLSGTGTGPGTAGMPLLTVFCACARIPPPLAHDQACCLMPAEAVSYLNDCICRQFVHPSSPLGGVSCTAPAWLFFAVLACCLMWQSCLRVMLLLYKDYCTSVAALLHRRIRCLRHASIIQG